MLMTQSFNLLHQEAQQEDQIYNKIKTKNTVTVTVNWLVKLFSF